jgi:CBS domain containing-hemolysin-like protein
MDNIVIILLAILFSAFFSGMEIAFVAANRLLVELDNKQGAFGSRLTLRFIHNPGQFIATMIVGNSISLAIYGFVFARMLTPSLSAVTGSDALTLIILTIIATLIILFFAEFVPKRVFLLSPNSFLRSLSIPTALFFFLFYPLTKVAFWVSNLLVAVATGKRHNTIRDEDNVFNRAELYHIINSIGQANEDDESGSSDIRIFRNAMEFANVKLRECMVPRTEIEALEVNEPVSEIKKKFIETGYSKILIFEDSIDNIIGYFELKDLYKNPSDIRSCLRKLAIVPETMAANKLLKIFVEEKRNVALVVDEFGGTSGMVTIEDVLEEIVGDIEDEHDTNEFTEKMTAPGEYLFSGRLDIDYLNEEYNLNLPEMDDYETLAGLILYHYGNMPRTNEVVHVGNVTIKILKVTATRLELVSLKLNA